MRLRRHQRQRRQRLRKLSNKPRKATDGVVAEESRGGRRQRGRLIQGHLALRLVVKLARDWERERATGGTWQREKRRRREGGTPRHSPGQPVQVFMPFFLLHSFIQIHLCLLILASFFLAFFSPFFFALFGVSLIQALHNLRLN